MPHTSILSADYLVADIVVELEGNLLLAELVKKYNMARGSKGQIDQQGFIEFSRAIQGYPVSISPGGSAANTLWTVGKVLGDEVSITFIGARGGSAYSRMISESLKEAGIKLLPEKFPAEEKGIRPETTVSFVVKFPKGGRAIVTYPGNADQIITSDIITDEMVKQADIVFLQGSLYRKFGEELPDKIIKLSEKHKKELWFALPTHGWFVEEHREMLIERMENHASVVLGNEEELMMLYGMDDDSEKALAKLDKAVRGNNKIKVAFITKGRNGAVILSKDGMQEIPALEADKIVNTLGAGDTAFAGFMIGCIKGLDYKKSAEIGLTLAKHKLTIDAARLPDPRKVVGSLI